VIRSAVGPGGRISPNVIGCHGPPPRGT
jgi:hypothetical protein